MYRTLKLRIHVNHEQYQLCKLYYQIYQENVWQQMNAFAYDGCIHYQASAISEAIATRSKWELFQLAKRQYRQFEKHHQYKMRKVMIWHADDVKLTNTQITVSFGKGFFVSQLTFALLCEKEEFVIKPEEKLCRVDLVWEKMYTFVNLLFRT